MNRLLAIGFEPAGHWLLDREKLRCELTRHATQRNILYAFVCDGEVKYVGKSAVSLAARMAGYRTPGKGTSNSTNVRNHARIRELLAQDVAVEIFVLPDSGLLHYGPFHLNLAAGLEDDVIRVLDPEWNGGTKERPPEPALSATEVVDEAPAPTGWFDFTLQPTYHQRGFFNVGVAASGYLGEDGATIELFLGRQNQPILGVINRRANTTGAPRIMGGPALRDWFQANASVMDVITVEVLSPTSIRLAPSAGRTSNGSE